MIASVVGSLLLLAQAVRAEDPIPPPPPPPPAVADSLAVPGATDFGGSDVAGGAAHQTSVASLEPARAPLTIRWRLKPFLGPTTVRFAGLEAFPRPAIAVMKNTETSHHPVSWAFIEGLEGSYLIDPLVRVAGKVAWLRTQQGETRATGTSVSGGVTTFNRSDVWQYRSELLLAMGGAGFLLPIDARTHAAVDLFLGAGLGTVSIDHQQFYAPALAGGTAQLDEATAEGRGVGFFPEFSVEVERDLTPALSAVVTLGYRFGGIGSFQHTHRSSVNTFGPQVEAEQGQAIRDASRHVLGADYGGLVLGLSLAARL